MDNNRIYKWADHLVNILDEEAIKKKIDAYNASIAEYRSRWTIPTLKPESFINMTLEDASENSGGWVVSPTIIDGKNIPMSASLCPIRVCVEIKNNKIIRITSVGS